MKTTQTVAGIATLLFVSLYGAEHLAIIKGLQTPAEVFNSFEALSCLFLVVIALVLFLGARDTAGSPPATTRAEEIQEPLSAPNSSAQSLANDSLAEKVLSEQRRAIVYLLSRLQEKGRVVDFALQDIEQFGDEQVGRVARIVHRGIAEVLGELTPLEPLHKGSEGDYIEVPKGQNGEICRLVGNVNKAAPFKGKVLHRGWKAVQVKVPVLSVTAESGYCVVQPMEVEVE